MPKASTPAADTSEFLTLEQIGSSDDRPVIEVPVPEWGGKVAIRAITPDQMAVARARSWDTRKKETDSSVLDAWLLTLSLVQPTLTFAGARQWYTERALGPVNAVMAAVLSASGIGAKAVEDAKSAADGELAEPAL